MKALVLRRKSIKYPHFYPFPAYRKLSKNVAADFIAKLTLGDFKRTSFL